MPIDPEFWRDLAQLPVLGLVLFVVGFVGLGLFRQWWVPGWLWRGAVAEIAELKAELKAARETNGTLTVQLARERGRRASDSKPDA